MLQIGSMILSQFQQFNNLHSFLLTLTNEKKIIMSIPSNYYYEILKTFYLHYYHLSIKHVEFHSSHKEFFANTIQLKSQISSIKFYTY